MAHTAATAEDVAAALDQARADAERDDPAAGLRMRVLFDTAKSFQHLAIDQVDRLMDEPAYEPRMAACCILDFTARRQIDDDERRALYELYLRRHDRITTWDMVDRSAPRVVGGYLAGGRIDPLHELARSDVPLERRTAITAPLYFVKYGSAEDITAGFTVAAQLVDDADPVVHQPVGIFLKHAGKKDPDGLLAFLDEHAPTMPRPAVRTAVGLLDPEVRARYVG